MCFIGHKVTLHFGLICLLFSATMRHGQGHNRQRDGQAWECGPRPAVQHGPDQEVGQDGWETGENGPPSDGPVAEDACWRDEPSPMRQGVGRVYSDHWAGRS